MNSNRSNRQVHLVSISISCAGTFAPDPSLWDLLYALLQLLVCSQICTIEVHCHLLSAVCGVTQV